VVNERLEKLRSETRDKYNNPRDEEAYSKADEERGERTDTQILIRQNSRI
jgi:hypothetical protein